MFPPRHTRNRLTPCTGGTICYLTTEDVRCETLNMLSLSRKAACQGQDLIPRLITQVITTFLIYKYMYNDSLWELEF